MGKLLRRDPLLKGNILNAKLLQIAIANNSANIDLETTFDANFDDYVIRVSGVNCNDNSLAAQLKVGGAYDTGLNYKYHNTKVTSSSGTYTASTSSGASQILLLTSHTQGDLEIKLSNPTSTSLAKAIFFDGYSISAGVIASDRGAGFNTAVTALTGIRFIASVGNIISGTFKLYGIPKTQ